MNYLEATYYFDYHHNSIQDLVDPIKEAATSENLLAIKLYEMVRSVEI